MNDFALNIEQVANDNAEPQVTFILTMSSEEVLRRDARVFSEDDMIAVSNQVTQASNLNPTDVDQTVAELIQPIRIKWLRSQEEKVGENPVEEQAAMSRCCRVRREKSLGSRVSVTQSATGF